MRAEADENRYAEVFERLAPIEFDELWPWQLDVLARVPVDGTSDVAIELPTGAGKTVVALLIAEEFRERTGKPIGYLTGTKQLTQQVKGEADRLGVPAVGFQGSKRDWSEDAVTDYEFGAAIGVMNFWNYFNESPGVGGAGLLILDDVHLAEGPLRDFFTVTIGASTDLFSTVLRRISKRFPYYTMINDLLDDLAPQTAAEMLSPLDSLEIADELRSLLDAHITDGTPAWWSWRRIRQHAASCCWLISPRGLTVTPWLPPSQTLDHFADPERRIYLSATVGDSEDLRRRIGCGPVTKITARVAPEQGRRYVAIVRASDDETPAGVVETAKPLVSKAGKALWLCARHTTANSVETALAMHGVAGTVLRLVDDNGAAETFAASDTGQLICAGRYDGMDFPDDACRLEILPEAPVATTDLEEFVTAYLRDAQFARARFAQRVAQALGRCNRSADDRAVYLLWNARFVSELGTRAGLAQLPDDLRRDIYAAVRRGSSDIDQLLGDAASFLDGDDFEAPQVPALPEPTAGAPAGQEVAGMHRLWAEDYAGAAERFQRVADGLDGAREYRGFWLAMSAMALRLAAERFGDRASGRRAAAAVAQAIAVGPSNTFFSRLRASQTRADKQGVAVRVDADRVFAAWDALLDRHGTGKRLEQWRAAVLSDFTGNDHDAVARRCAELGRLFGLSADAPQATQGEPDAIWELTDPRGRLLFEVKLAPKGRKLVIGDVDQLEGAVRAASEGGKLATKGLLLTPHDEIDRDARKRMRATAALQLADFAAYAEHLLDLLQEYAAGWSPDDAQVRDQTRAAIEPRLLDVRDLYDAIDSSDAWVDIHEAS